MCKTSFSFSYHKLLAVQHNASQGNKFPLENKIAPSAAKGDQILPCQVRNPDAIWSGFKKSFVPWNSFSGAPLTWELWRIDRESSWALWQHADLWTAQDARENFIALIPEAWGSFVVYMVCFLAFFTVDSEFSFLKSSRSAFSLSLLLSSKYFKSLSRHFSSVLEWSGVKCMYSVSIYWKYCPSLFKLYEF